MRAPKTMKARGWVALTATYLFFMLTFGLIQGLTHGGWWGFLLWTALYAFLALMIVIVPRVMRWVDAGERS